MDKKEIAEVLETILNGLTEGENFEKKIEVIKKSHADELNKINNEKQFYERVIRFCLMTKYISLRESLLNKFESFNGAVMFSKQSEAVNHYTTQPMSGLGFDLDDFNRFVDEYLTAARKDTFIGIKEEK